jgi:tRNA(Arg) A34 adenosine deaminase TadA
VNISGEESLSGERMRFMQRAIALADEAVISGKGRPFGAVIVRNGRIVAEAHNEVLQRMDPTAHAEIVVIGRACRELGRLDLSDCDLYVNSTPCPMCATALMWSRIGRIFHALAAADAAAQGFDDSDFFAQVAKPVDRRRTPAVQLHGLRDDALRSFALWRRAALGE